MAGGNSNNFQLKSGTRQGCLFSPFSFNIIFEVLTRTIRKEKETKVIQIENGVKVFLFADDTIVYVGNTKTGAETS